MSLEKFTLVGDNHFPSVELDPTTGKFTIGGMSRPEDVGKIFTPIIEWIETYGKNPSQETRVDFRFDYFNTASAKVLYDLLAVLDEIHLTGHDVVVNWYYEEPDIDMKGAGEEFNDLIDLEINMIPESR